MSSSWGGTTSCTRKGWGQLVGKQCCRKCCEIPGEQQVNHGPAMYPWSTLGCTMLSITCRSYKVIFSLCSALVRQTWSTESSPGLPSTRDLGILQQVQWRSRRMTKGLQHLRYKESLRELGQFNLEKKKLWRILSVCINTWWGTIWKLEPVSSQRHTLKRQNTIGTNWKYIFPAGVVEYWNKLPRKGVESSSLQIFKTQIFFQFFFCRASACSFWIAKE